MKYFMRQCTLQKDLGNGSVLRTVSWIPEKFSVLGKSLKLKDNDEWRDGFKVIFVGNYRMENIDVQKQSIRYRTQRRASDRLRSDKIEE